MSLILPNKLLSPFRIESNRSIIPSNLTGSYDKSDVDESKISGKPGFVSSVEKASAFFENPDTCDVTVLNQRTEEDINVDANSVIRSVTAHMDTLPVGTFKYKIFKYPSDIDIFENLDECCTFNVSKTRAAETIQRIVQNVISSSTIIFTDFKAGYDDRYKIYTGTINHKIDDYDPVLIRRDIDNLRSAKLLTCPEYHKLISLMKDVPTVNDIITLNENLRDFWVVRWTSEEILRGYTVRPGNYRLYLDVALTHGSIVKLDTIAKISSPVEESRYIEVTNFFLITQKDKYGNTIFLSEELGDYAQSLLGDVYKYYDTNILKSIKRLWMYLAYQGKICDLGMFTELFSSDIALYSQIVGDLEVALFLLSSKLSYDNKFLKDTINRKLSSLRGECANPALYVHTKTDIEYLTKVRECLIAFINTRTRQWLQDHNIDILAKSYQM